jgi:UV DNA damage repair endonuclease
MPDPKLNQSTTTIKWLSEQTLEDAHKRLWDLMQANIRALSGQIEWLGTQPKELRMFRITSDLLVAYTHQSYRQFYFSPDGLQFLESSLS